MKTALTDLAPSWIKLSLHWHCVLRCFRSGWSKAFIALLTASAMTTEVAAGEPQGSAKVGLLWISAAPRVAHYVRQFKEGMRELGWVDGRTVFFAERYANSDMSRLPALAAELVALDVDVLYVTDGALPAARQVVGGIPIVCPDFYDPIAEGVTRSMAHPDGNVTGVSWQSVESAAKRFQFTRELIPGLRSLALLFDSTDPGAVLEAEGLRAAAVHAGIDLRAYAVRHPSDFPTAFAMMKRAKPEALLVSVTPLTGDALDRIISFASGVRLPLISELPEYAEKGAILTYGPDILDTYRRGAYFVDRILKGTKVADLPIEQPTKFKLVVNLKTAKALGLKIPESILVGATQVIR
jgi:putative ABC transport system substrate-binding protein